MRRTCILFLLLFAMPATAQDLQLAEHKIKAGMLYNFLKYTDWPATDAAKPMTICLLGRDPFGESLRPIEGRSVNQRSITIQIVRGPADAADCHLVFFQKKDLTQWSAWQARLAAQPVLTVSDAPGFVQRGGMIGFDEQQRRVHVTLNLQAVQQAGLTVQERLLRLVSVTGTAGGAP